MIASPPQIIEVVKYMPLPADCGLMEIVTLPPGSSAMDVMNELNRAVKAYNDKVTRCYKATPQ